MVIATPTPVNVVIQRSRRAKPMTVHLDKVKPFTGPEPISWLERPESTGPADGVIETTPTADHSNPLMDTLENDPPEIRDPQMETPKGRPKRTRRPPEYLAGYEWKNQALTYNLVRSA